MEFNEEKFTNLVKKNRKKRTLRTIFITLLTLFFTFLIVSVPYLRYYNYRPFQDEKISGVPDNHLKLSQEEMGLSGLVFEDAANYRFNVRGKGIIVKALYYEKDKLIKSVEINSLGFGEKIMMSGNLTYGVVTDSEGLPLTLKSKLSASGAQTIINELDLKQFKLDASELLVSTNSPFLVDQTRNSPYKVTSNRPLVIKNWATSGTMPADPKDMLAPEYLQTVPQAIFITAEFI